MRTRPPAGGVAPRHHVTTRTSRRTIPISGQFIDHDITFDPAWSLQRQNDIDALVDFRTPRFDLDSLYGSGPADEPFQYVRASRGLRFLVEQDVNGIEDLPRDSQDAVARGGCPALTTPDQTDRIRATTDDPS
jgi:hypothetical protein